MAGEKQSFTARALNQLEDDVHELTRGVFAEDAMGGPEGWMGVANAMKNRLKSGNYGNSYKEVLNKSLSSVRKQSHQYKLSGSPDKMNQYERNIFNKIKDVVRGVVRGDVPDNTKGATHFENIQQFGMPYWAPEMTPTGKIGSHTYFKEKAPHQEGF